MKMASVEIEKMRLTGMGPGSFVVDVDCLGHANILVCKTFHTNASEIQHAKWKRKILFWFASLEFLGGSRKQ